MEASLAATRIAIMALNLARGGHISMQSALFLTIFVYLSCNTDFQGYGIKLGDHGARSSPIESLLFPPNGQFFYTKYARQSQPVLFKGAASHWPAVKKWPNITYLKEEHGKDVFTVEFRKNFQASFPMRKNLKLQMFFEQYKRKNIYLDSLFGKDSRMIDEVYFPLPLISISHRVSVDNLNLLVSSGNTSSAFHQDGYENLLTVVSGYKDVILYDNRYTRDFDADRYSIAAGVLDMDPENLTTADLKKLAEIPYYTARIEPGDILYIPRYWWHQVRSFNDPNIAIGMWFDIFDFQGEFERRRIDDTEDVVKKTEIFLELLGKEPLEIKPLDTIESNAIHFMTHNQGIFRKDVCSQRNK